MIVDFKLLVQIQLIIVEPQQVFKIAFAHVASGSLVLPASSHFLISARSPGIFHLREYQRLAPFISARACFPDLVGILFICLSLVCNANIIIMRSFLYLFNIDQVSEQYCSLTDLPALTHHSQGCEHDEELRCPILTGGMSCNELTGE